MSNLSNKKFLITGVTGYLGSHIANILFQMNPSVSIIGTTKSLKNDKRIKQFKQAIHLPGRQL